MALALLALKEVGVERRQGLHEEVAPREWVATGESEGGNTPEMQSE